jgi:hypothetical protein
MVVRKLGSFEIEGARLRISREPQVTVEVVWTPSPEQRHRKDELMRGGPYEVSIPTGELWNLLPQAWQETPEGEVVVTLRSGQPSSHGPDGSPFSLDMENGASEAEKHEVSEAFRSMGFEPGDIGLQERRSLGDHPWLVMVSVPLGIFLKSFLEQAGHDAAEALRDFIKRIFKARRSSTKAGGQFVLIDEDTGLWVTLLTELPIEACRKLIDLDLSQLGDRYQALIYNTETGEWEFY